MCNNTSLSTFLDGVSFDDNFTMDLEEFDNDFLDLLDPSCTTGMDAPADMEMMEMDPLPPLDLTMSMEHDDELDALLSPPVEATTTSTTTAREEPEPTTSTSGITSSASLEKLAHCMRTSEMALAQKRLDASQSQIFSKANAFFTGSRATITPELEMSRQRVWNLIKANQANQQQHLEFAAASFSHKAPTTAAA